MDRNPNLSTIDKFNYLKALLEGSAARSVQGLSLTEASDISPFFGFFVGGLAESETFLSDNPKSILSASSSTSALILSLLDSNIVLNLGSRKQAMF